MRLEFYITGLASKSASIQFNLMLKYFSCWQLFLSFICSKCCCFVLNQIWFCLVRLSGKHYWRVVGGNYYLMGKMPCLHLFLLFCLSVCLICLHYFLCIYFFALQSFCPSVCLTANPSVDLSFLFDRPCLISPAIAATLKPSHFITGPHLPESPSEYLFSNFTAHYFFMSSEEKRFLALLHPDPQGRRGQPPGDQTGAVC